MFSKACVPIKIGIITSKKQNRINNSFILSRFSDAILGRIFELCKCFAKKM
jgi:hypothetical protein